MKLSRILQHWDFIIRIQQTFGICAHGGRDLPFFLNGGAPLFDENKIVKFCAAIKGAPFSLFLLYKVFSEFS